MRNSEYEAIGENELRQLCKTRGISISPKAKRDTIIKRLHDYDANHNVNNSLFLNDHHFQKNNERHELFHKENKDTKSYYLQLHIDNVSDYFNAGIIYPLDLEESDIYKNENRKTDLISQFPDRLLLSSGIIGIFDNTQVLLELIIKTEEYQSIYGEPIGYLIKPLPVSRVKTIYFATELSKTTFIASINTFPDCYIPSDICKIIKSDIKTINPNLEKFRMQKNILFPIWRDKLKRFDRIMGLLSFFKNSGIIYAEKENTLREYPQTYVNSLWELNKTYLLPSRGDQVFKAIFLPNEPVHFKFESQRHIFKQTLEAIFSDKEFSISLVLAIIGNALTQNGLSDEENTELTDIIQYLRQWEGRRIAYQKLFEIDVIKKYLPVLILIFLAKFPSKSFQNTDRQSVRIALIESQKYINRNFAEYILAVLGLYYGYRSMIKNDTNLKINDDYFRQIAESVQTIKFKLDNYFDRFVIETVYQFIDFEHPISDELHYLRQDNQMDKFEIPNPSLGENTYLDKTAILLDKPFIIIEKISRLENLLNIINERYGAQFLHSHYLTHFILKNIGFSKEQMMEIIRKNSQTLSLDEIEKIVNIDTDKNDNK